MRKFGDIATEDTQVPSPEFMTALCDDLNTPKAISILLEQMKTLDNSNISSFYAAAKLLGIAQHNPDEWLGYGETQDNQDAQKIDALITERKNAKTDKNFARADEIRNELTAMGIAIEDTPEGTIWKKT